MQWRIYQKGGGSGCLSSFYPGWQNILQSGNLGSRRFITKMRQITYFILKIFSE